MGIRPTPLVFATLLVLSSVPVPATADAPLADAGLDQTVTRGTTVQLDATGSQDPDGSIKAYHWDLQTPDGSGQSPACTTCGTTTFTVDAVGTYEVTVTVTDDDGERATDTLYVEVTPGEPPAVVLTGPTTLRVGQNATYTAEVTAGIANLDQLVWFADGTPVATDSIDGRTDTSTYNRTFPTPSTHQISARAIDTDDQTATDTIQSTVLTAPEEPQNGGSSNGPIGQRGTATISGPKVVTGTDPVTGHYSVTGSTIDGIEWWKNGERIGHGEDLNTQFAAGTHTLYARVTYTDGTDDIARFDDGTTTVIADPKPEIDTTTLHGRGGLHATATAIDQYKNLRRFELHLDGDPVITRDYTRAEMRQPNSGTQLDMDTVVKSLEPGNYTAQLRATDGRDQTTIVERQIEIVGPPEIIRSEFVHDGDLESYHPRIDPERYTAKHVLEIDLNGVTPSELNITQSVSGFQEIDDNNVCRQSREVVNGRLIIQSCVAGRGITDGIAKNNITWRTYWDRHIDDISTVPSSPEVRVRVLNGGAIERAKQWGLVVDASQSFDPDGGPLIFEWSIRGSDGVRYGSIGKLESLAINQLVVRDDEGQKTIFKERFAAHFNPEIVRIVPISSGPYLPSENVRFLVQTKMYELPQATQRSAMDLALVPNSGEVLQHLIYQGEFSADPKDDTIEPYFSEAPKNRDQQGWIVVVPAQRFLNHQPGFTTFNKNNKAETIDQYEFPAPEVLRKGSVDTSQLDLSTEYVVERPIYQWETARTISTRDKLKARGYEAISAVESGYEWIFEKQEKLSDAQYRTDEKSFKARGRRSTFLSLNPSWSGAGSELVSAEITEYSSVWRSDKTGPGTFTGVTRRKQVQPPKYRTTHQYRYYYTETETRTRWRTKTFQYQDRESYTVHQSRCSLYGCYTYEETKYRWVTKTTTRRVRSTYTVDVRKSDTYWSAGKRRASDTATGRTRTKLLKSARYETQYEYQVERTRDVTQRVYVADRRRLIKPANYQWNHYKTTRSKLVANELLSTPSVRLVKKEPAVVWQMRAESGVRRKSISSTQNTSEVVKTDVTVSGKVATDYLDSETGAVIKTVTTTEGRSFQVSGYITTDEAMDIFLNKKNVSGE